MILNIFFVVIGFLLLIQGANTLVKNASAIAIKLHVSEMIVGLTIVSIGTSMPELFVSITSALQDSADITLGNVVGSNVCNLLLILGISSVLCPLSFSTEIRRVQIPICIFSTVLFFLLCNNNQQLSRIDGALLFLLFTIFLGYTIVLGKKQKHPPKTDILEGENPSLFSSLCFIVLSIIALKWGGDFVVKHASIIALQLSVSEKIVGLTVVALGTSLPELVTSILAAMKGNQDIALGNIIGSNIFNILLIAGLSAIIKPISFDTTYNIQLSILLIATILLWIFALTNQKQQMTRLHGIFYLILYGIYVLLLF